MSGPVDGFLVDREDVPLAAELARIAVIYLQRVNGGAWPRAIAFRDQLARFARTTPPQASATAEHANLPGAADPAESAPRIGVTAAAALAGLSHQHVRRLCRRGELSATRAPSGAWAIDRASVQALAAHRGRTAR